MNIFRNRRKITITKMTMSLQYKRSISTNFSLVKGQIGDYFLFIQTQYIYFYLKEDLINLNMLVKYSQLLLNKKNKNFRKVKFAVASLLSNIQYSTILKIKLIGRHFKLRVKKANVLSCNLNYSHRYWLYKRQSILRAKHRAGQGRALFCYPISLEAISIDKNYLNILRPNNLYTSKGMQDMKLIKYKRKGKSVAT